METVRTKGPFGGFIEYTVLEDNTCSITNLQVEGLVKVYPFPVTIAGRKVSHISNTALMSLSHVEEVEIPDTVKMIGDLVGEGNAFVLTEPEFPDSVKRISVEDGNDSYMSVDGVLYSRDQKILYFYPRKKANKTFRVAGSTVKISRNAFSGARYLEEITVLADEIGEAAFKDCIYLASVFCDVVKVDDRAFANCSSLKSATFGNQLEYIGDYAFSNCTSLVSFNSDSDKINHLSALVFDNCCKLETVSFMNNKEFIVIDNVVYRSFSAAFESPFGSIPEGEYGLVIYPSRRGGANYVLPLNTYCIENGALSNLEFLHKILIPSECIADIDKITPERAVEVEYLSGGINTPPNWKIGEELQWNIQ